jgi:uncharacterized protein YndB with AHSA1/START domain
MYHFVTNWFFNAPIERVWKEIEDPKTWSIWLQDFKKITPRPLESMQQVGNTVDVEYKGNLPYTFRFALEVTKAKPLALIELKATGDLIGTGKWVLESRNPGTAVTYYWDVGVTNPIFNLLIRLPFVKAITESNHNATMDRAFQALKSRLEVPID